MYFAKGVLAKSDDLVKSMIEKDKDHLSPLVEPAVCKQQNLARFYLVISTVFLLIGVASLAYDHTSKAEITLMVQPEEMSQVPKVAVSAKDIAIPLNGQKKLNLSDKEIISINTRPIIDMLKKKDKEIRDYKSQSNSVISTIVADAPDAGFQ